MDWGLKLYMYSDYEYCQKRVGYKWMISNSLQGHVIMFLTKKKLAYRCVQKLYLWENDELDLWF